MKLSRLTPMARKVTNVYCGLVNFTGKRMVGCGRPGIHTECFYEPHNSNLTSTVALCDKCLPKLVAANPSDWPFHRHNLVNDKSVFESAIPA